MKRHNRVVLSSLVLLACATLGLSWASAGWNDFLWSPWPNGPTGGGRAIVEVVTLAGSEYAVVFASVVVYLAYDRRLGKKLFLLFLVSGYLNVLLKGVFRVPRPSGAEAGDYSFPSGHVQITSSFLGYLALHFGSWGWLALLCAMTALIAITRVVLNAHFPADTLAGFAVGAGAALLFDSFQSGVHRNRTMEDANVRFFLVLVIPLAAVAIMALMWGRAPEAAYRLAGLAMGFGIGDTVGRQKGLSVPISFAGRGALVLMAAATLCVFALASMLVPENAQWIQLAVMGCAGFAVSGGIPLIHSSWSRWMMRTEP